MTDADSRPVWIAVEFDIDRDPMPPSGERGLISYKHGAAWWSDSPTGKRRPLSATGAFRVELPPGGALVATLDVENTNEQRRKQPVRVTPISFEVDTLDLGSGGVIAGWACALYGQMPREETVARLRRELAEVLEGATWGYAAA